LEERRRRGFYQARLNPEVSVSEDGRTVDLKLEVDSGPHVRVVFAGDPLPADRRDELVPIEREGSADEDLLEDSSHRIEEYFRSQGYRNASAPYRREQSNGELLVTFTIARGPLYRVSQYDITGMTALSLDEIRPLLRVRVDQPFADSRLDADVSTIETLYRRQGFAAVRAGSAIEPQTAAQLPVVPVGVRIVV